MLDAFWSGVGEELARHWVARVLTPAFAFWAAGLALVWWDAHAAAVAANGWAATIVASAAVLGALPVVVQGVLVLGGLVLVAASAVVAERLTFPVLRLLEGYWTRPAWLRRLLVGYRQRRFDRVQKRAAPLQQRQYRGSLTIEEFREMRRCRADPDANPERLADLEVRAMPRFTPQERAQLGRDLVWLLTTPGDDELRMPTRLGDILRAAERRPAAGYGMDAVICWNALWQLLPADACSELVQARSGLDAAVRGWLWGALFLVWTPVNWWAALVGFGIPLLSYRFGILPRATAFGQLVVTAFDLHRMELYDALRLPAPASPDEERATAGPRATAALAGTLAEPGLRYCHPQAAPPRAAG